MYAGIFVGGASRVEVQELLAPGVGGWHAELIRGPVTFDVRKGPDAGRGPADDFLYWPVLIEAEWADDVETKDVVPVFATMLNELWAAGLDAVVASDFEDQLPFSGGIKRPLRQPPSASRAGDIPAR